MTQAVVCLGNELVGDDGVGIRVGRVLQRLPWPREVDVLIRPNLGLDLIDLLLDYQEVVIVDAMTSGQDPGTCARLEPAETSKLAVCPSCSHSLGIPEILQVVSRMYPERANRAVRIVGVEAAAIDQFGVGLSPAVRDALPEAVDQVLDALGGLDGLRGRARDIAEAEAQADVTLSDILAPVRA